MPYATTDDGVKLYLRGDRLRRPVVFVHEFAGDHRAWEPQMRHFGQRYRGITYDARGYPPSDVPQKPDELLARRAPPTTSLAVLDHLRIDKAHIVGLSMGGFATLHFGFRHPKRALSLVVGRLRLRRREGPAGQVQGRGRGPSPKFTASSNGMAAFAEKYAYGPTRVQFENKDPRGFAEFKTQLGEHSALGSANTQLGVQGERPVAL